LPVACERAGDELELWMPRLTRIDQISARLDRGAETVERSPNLIVVGVELVEARDHADGEAALARTEPADIKGISLKTDVKASNPRCRISARAAATLALL